MSIHLNKSQLVFYVIIAIISTSLVLQYENFTNEVTYTKSDIDDKAYLVRNLPDRKEAANLLANTKKKCIHLVRYISLKYPDNPEVNRLLLKYNPDNITESSKNSKYTSYSVNKGEKIVFCIRSRDSKEQLVEPKYYHVCCFT